MNSIINILNVPNHLARILFAFSLLFTTVEQSLAESLPQVQCTDTAGQPIQFVADPTEQENAYAVMTNSGPIVGFDSNWIFSFPRHIGIFVLLHECGHHALGHPVSHDRSLDRRRHNEVAADCWAAQRWMDIYFNFENWFSGDRIWSKMDDVVSEVMSNPGGWVHKRGPFRALDLMNCFDS